MMVDADLTITPIRTAGLGDTTYVVSHGGIGLVVDPQRDLDRFEAVLDGSGTDLRLVVEQWRRRRCQNQKAGVEDRG